MKLLKQTFLPSPNVLLASLACCSVALSSLLAVPLARAQEAHSSSNAYLLKNFDKEISYHQKMISNLSRSNKFLSQKYPLSAGSPAFHEQKVAQLQKSKAALIDALSSSESAKRDSKDV